MSKRYPSDDEVRVWLDSKPGWISLVCGWFFYLWHQRLPKRLNRPMTLKSIGLGFLQFLAFGFISGSPVWLQIWFDANAEIEILWFPLLLLVGCFYLSKFLGFLSRGNKYAEVRDREETQLSTSHFLAIDLIDEKILSVSGRVRDQSAVDRAVKELLKCIAHRARLTIGREGADYLEVTLLMFETPNAGETTIRERSGSARKRGKSVKSNELLAYHVAKNGLTGKVVNDFKNQKLFPYVGASKKSEVPPYRSIMVLTLPHRELPGTDDVCVRGAITIDGEKPYDFWGEIEDSIQIQVQPFVKLIDVLLTNHQCGVKIKKADSEGV